MYACRLTPARWASSSSCVLSAAGNFKLVGLVAMLGEGTSDSTLPEGFQRSEFLITKGAVDLICDRRELRKTVANSLAMLQRQPADAVI